MTPTLDTITTDLATIGIRVLTATPGTVERYAQLRNARTFNGSFHDGGKLLVSTDDPRVLCHEAAHAFEWVHAGRPDGYQWGFQQGEAIEGRSDRSSGSFQRAYVALRGLDDSGYRGLDGCAVSDEDADTFVRRLLGVS